ncbi:MAG: molybdopterin molybdotransferase MoeA [Alphaproteobacteria bacterium]|nr:molybdopterin molybdotransferase MoeA [Alphaproteobacteria bacterium]
MAGKDLLPVAEAQQSIIDAVGPLPAEQISLADGLGRVLAREVASRRDQPPMAMSAMDGYAVRAADVASLPATLNVVGYAPAGHAFDGSVGPGEAVRIFTGAPVPDGADTIVIQENTEQSDEIVRVVDGTAPVGRYIRPAGLDFATGDVLLPRGKVLTARDVGLSAAMNVPWLSVHRKPRISILATGDEIVMPGDPIGRDQIVSSNALSLAAFITAQGGTPLDLGIAPDEEDGLRALAAGAHGSDILVTTGGASVGDHDLVQSVLGDIGLKVDFWRIAMRPGKPLMFGRIDGTFLIGLPGNPVSSLVCAIMFLAPAIRKMLGMENLLPETGTARLGSDLPENDEREDYLRASLTRDENGDLIATPYGKQDSSMFATIARADALVIRKPFIKAAMAGSPVQYIPLKDSVFSI